MSDEKQLQYSPDELPDDEPDEATDLYDRVRDIVRVYGTDDVRKICDLLEEEARRGE